MTAAALGIALLPTSGALTLGASTAQAAVACRAEIQLVNDWGSGYTANLVVTNSGDPWTSWTVGFAFDGNDRIDNGWNGSYTQSGKNVTVRNAAWNGNVATGGTATFGFNASGSVPNRTLPKNFTVNGVACQGEQPAPIVALTSPAPGAAYTQGTAIPLAATAAAANGATISKVEFYDDDELIATDTTSPFSYNWTGASAGAHSIQAIATDSTGAVGSSQPVGINVTAAPSVVVNPTSLSVATGSTGTFNVSLSQAPTSNVTVTVARASGNTGLSVTRGATLTFTPSNWNVPQAVTISAAEGGSGTAEFTATAAGLVAGRVTVRQIAEGDGENQARFLEMYNDLKNPANGYFSPEGVPYHSVETLMVEAPDHGHQTTSEAFSYFLWLEAEYGQITGEWQPFNDAWEIMETYAIPRDDLQPNQGTYNPNDPATYAPEHTLPEYYPARLDNSVPVGRDPIADELSQTYGTDSIYGMHWLIDVDNTYGFGECGDGTTRPAYMNTYQRGMQESVWETIPQPSCDTFAHGGRNGFLDLFTGDASYAQQWKYTNAPDADARAVQVAYWAKQWADEQGKGAEIAGTLDKAAKMGDYLRYSFFDKYFKRIGNCQSPSCPVGTGKDSSHYLLSWYYAWGGSLGTNAWSWRMGSSASHGGYQNPVAAYALSQVDGLIPESATGRQDWATSLDRQVEFYRWLQSSEGAIAGGATNSWQGAYAPFPAGASTFYGMAYDWQPVWNDPPSNNWFGFQAWGMERLAEYCYISDDQTACDVTEKWVDWALQHTTINPDGSYLIPSTLNWSGQPDTWNPNNPGPNNNLHVTVRDYTNDVGVTGSYAKVLSYWAAASGDTEAQETAAALLDGLWGLRDNIGVSVEETRADYSRFTQEYSTSNPNHDGVYVPAGWRGTMPNGDVIEPGVTFLDIRSFYKDDPEWPKVEAYLNGGPAPTFRYHRFWAQTDVATAMSTYARLFE
ncbi:glycoside hydrolase family 48 protein [Allostreptomyces psammosilenae]|uniref:glycoside hydrolase family 48 protein n=1 Tax=Allostreptomyces psammosilenae TaxID=1892865 RepID=UPI0035E435E1